MQDSFMVGPYLKNPEKLAMIYQVDTYSFCEAEISTVWFQRLESSLSKEKFNDVNVVDHEE